MNALTYATLATVASSTLTRGGWQAFDVARPAVVQLLPPLDPSAPSDVNYLELYAAPTQIPEATHGAIKAIGSRLWLPVRGRWYLQLLADGQQNIDLLFIDAPSDAWANAYVNRQSATSVAGGYSELIAIGGDEPVFRIGTQPDAASVTIVNTNLSSDAIAVNLSATTDSATRGELIEKGDRRTFDFTRYAPSSVWACPVTGTARVVVLVTN